MENREQNSLQLEPSKNSSPIPEQQQAIRKALDEIERTRDARLTGRDRAMGFDYLISEIRRDVGLLADEISGNIEHPAGGGKAGDQQPDLADNDYER